MSETLKRGMEGEGNRFLRLRKRKEAVIRNLKMLILFDIVVLLLEIDPKTLSKTFRKKP